MEISPNTVKSLPALCQGQDGRDYAVRDCWKDLYRPASASPAVICFRDSGLLVNPGDTPATSQEFNEKPVSGADSIHAAVQLSQEVKD